MKNKVLCLFCGLLISAQALSQTLPQKTSFWTPADTLNKERLYWTTGVVGGGLVVSLGVLYGTWYSDYSSGGFHFHNDNNNWEGIDKVGHTMTAYTMGAYSYDLLHWSGVKENQAVWYGGMVGFTYLGIVEIMDGTSDGWGFSWGDMAANTAGTALFIGQQLGWKEQRMRLKYSYYPTSYAALNPELLGNGGPESALKDYNGQTYWLSVNPGTFAPDNNWWPKWLAIAGGYGATGMVGASSNPPEYSHIPREQQWYLSLDLDLSRVETGSRFWNTILHGLNWIKIPAPAIEYRPQSGFVKGHWLMF